MSEVPAPRSVRTRDLRALARLPFEVRVDVLSDHNFFAGLSRDLSEGGLFVATDLGYDVGADVEIRLRFPGDAEPTALLTRVCWVRAASASVDGVAGVGLCFVDLPALVADRIRAFTALRQPMLVAR